VVGQAVDAPRAVVLEAAAQQADAVGQQRAGERVAREALVAPAFEREAQCATPVDPLAGLGTEALRHDPSLRGSAPQRYVRRNSSSRLSRSAMNHVPLGP